LLAALLVFSAFAIVLDRKMHHKLTWGTYQDIESIAVVLSDQVYRLHAGYLSYGAVLDLLNRRLGDKAPVDVSPTKRAGDADYINEAIRDAAAIDVIRPAHHPGDFSPIVREELVPIMAEDLGRADYYKLSFALFGIGIESMHYLFFAVLFLTCMIYCAAFSDDFRLPRDFHTRRRPVSAPGDGHAAPRSCDAAFACRRRHAGRRPGVRDLGTILGPVGSDRACPAGAAGLVA
jgi:hypothetical protein